jgi:hypothetical protein
MAFTLFARNAQGERRASPAQYKLLLVTHLMVSVGWLGTAFAKLVLGLVAVATAAPALLQAVDVLNVAFPPLAIGTAVSGVLLSLGTRWGLVRYTWVVTKIALTVAVIATGIRFADDVAQSALASLTAAGLDPLAALGVIGLSVAHVLMLIAATVLSVYKPWGRFPLMRRLVPAPTVVTRREESRI